LLFASVSSFETFNIFAHTAPGNFMNTDSQPSPQLFFDTITGYQKAAALKAGLDLDIFTRLAAAPASAADLAKAAQASERGMRILCDNLAVQGFLQKNASQYSLTPDSSIFLNRNSPAYLGGTTEFLLSADITGAFANLTEAVRRGGTAHGQGFIEPNNPMWITFARAMGGMMVPASTALAELVALDPNQPSRILDIAAGHGVWGLAFAKRYPKARVVALDWAAVLQVAKENAAKAGVADRFTTITGSAFEANLGTDYDAVLIPNFLHHFNATDCAKFLKRVHASLRPGGRVAIVEFIPNPDRITPPSAAGFSLVMLAMTPEGDAYTFDEYAAMLTQAGFQRPAAQPLPASMNQALIATK
jgi:ubiquinone/menaquinone biosynthesis C-methylase UbiE